MRHLLWATLYTATLVVVLELSFMAAVHLHVQ